MAAAYLALGDSYTIGEGVPRADAWPARLGARLREHGHDLGPVDTIATTGWTTDELAAAIAAHDPPAGRALVSLLVGVNNQYRGGTLAAYRTSFAGLLDQAIALADRRPHRVIVVSIPDWGVTPFARARGSDAARVAAEIDAFNAAACALALARGAHWTNITSLSRGIARDLLATDGLHPSAAQYTLWAAHILPEALAVLAAD